MTDPSTPSSRLDIGGVFDAAADIYKKTAGTVWIVALILLIPAGIVAALLDDGGGRLVGSIVQLVASAWLVGAVVRIVQDVEEDGRVDWGVGQILSSVTPRLLPIILLQFVTSILIGIGFVLLIIPGIILTLMWAVAMPSLVVEDNGVFDSMSRSSDLTSGNRTRVLGVGLVLIGALIVIAVVGALLVAVSPVLGAIVVIALGVLLYPYVSILSAVLFYRLRELKEGAATT